MLCGLVYTRRVRVPVKLRPQSLLTVRPFSLQPAQRAQLRLHLLLLPFRLPSFPSLCVLGRGEPAGQKEPGLDVFLLGLVPLEATLSPTGPALGLRGV